MTIELTQEEVDYLLTVVRMGLSGITGFNVYEKLTRAASVSTQRDVLDNHTYTTVNS